MAADRVVAIGPNPELVDHVRAEDERVVVFVAGDRATEDLVVAEVVVPAELDSGQDIGPEADVESGGQPEQGLRSPGLRPAGRPRMPAEPWPIRRGSSASAC